jgi:hypothetical protein
MNERDIPPKVLEHFTKMRKLLDDDEAMMEAYFKDCGDLLRKIRTSLGNVSNLNTMAEIHNTLTVILTTLRDD